MNANNILILNETLVIQASGNFFSSTVPRKKEKVKVQMSVPGKQPPFSIHGEGAGG